MRRPKRLYHGGPTGLSVGDYLLPASALGLPDRVITPNQPRYSPHKVYLTERVDYARIFGAVYVAEPIGPLTPDPDARLAWRCPRARIVEVIG